MPCLAWLFGFYTAKSKSANLIAKLYGSGFSAFNNNVTMKIKDYVRQPSTWLGLAKLGAAIGLYSTGIGGAVAQAIVAIFGLVDVIRNEKTGE